MTSTELRNANCKFKYFIIKTIFEAIRMGKVWVFQNRIENRKQVQTPSDWSKNILKTNNLEFWHSPFVLNFSCSKLLNELYRTN